MKTLRLFLFSITLFCFLSACNKNNTPTVGIIEPLEHTAMTEIVEGYSTTLKSLYPKKIRIKIENAQNDANLKRAIIQKMRDSGYAVILPIGVDATQMTLSMVHRQPVVSLASDLSDDMRHQLNPCNVAVVQDEIPASSSLAFIHAVYPQLSQLTLVHSASDKVIPQVKETVALAKTYGIFVKPLMVTNLPELYTIALNMPEKTQAIFVLKDSMIVSGMPTLSKIAADKKVPLITSDQGSIQEQAGGAFALGVHEREIGVEGAKLTAAILNGTAPCQLPIVKMKRLTVFVNEAILKAENQSFEPIASAAKQFNYPVEKVVSSSASHP